MTVQNFSYHSHTTFSDGRNSLEEMIAKAKSLGFCELGVSDHLCVHKNMSQSLSCPFWRERGNSHIFKNDFKKILPEFQKHCDDIRQLAKKENFKLYVGFEVDFFTYDGWLEELKDFLSHLDYDYVISGNHLFFDENCENVFDLYDLPVLCSDLRRQQEFVHRHFATIKKAVESGVFKFLAHIDYVRKLGDAIYTVEQYLPEQNKILDALQRQNMAMEISTKGLRKVNDFYPQKAILQEAAKRNIKFVISDDAHATNELGDRFDLAEKRLLQFGIKNRLKF